MSAERISYQKAIGRGISAIKEACQFDGDSLPCSHCTPDIEALRELASIAERAEKAQTLVNSDSGWEPLSPIVAELAAGFKRPVATEENQG